MASTAPIILTDGSTAFDFGVDSSRVTTIQNELNPNGLPRNGLAWLINGTVRDGGITCRNGWDYLAQIANGTTLYQGGFFYEPLQGYPYLVVLIGGVLYRIDLTAPYAVTDLTGGNAALLMPATEEQPYFCQAEEFLIIQAGDYVTLPLIWDGALLRRSNGPVGAELPAAGPMVYYMGRLWYANGRSVSAGDIVGGASGTIGYNFRDAVLHVTENPLCVGGDGFTVPTNAGNIRAAMYGSNLDSALGQGQLFIFTRKQIYALQVPVTRTDWIGATNNNQPLMTVVQFVNGAVNDRSLVSVNGDIFFQSLEPGIRSLITAIRYYQQWGNTVISANEDRILRFNDRSLLHMASGISFQNRLYQTALPRQTPQGVVHDAIIPLDFDPISSFGKEHQPNWEGHHEVVPVLQLFSGDFGGLERAFAMAVSPVDSTIQLWEITNYERFDHNTTDDRRITWVTETPGYTFNLPLKLKQLKGGEIWIDRAYGTVTVQVWYRVDADPCWIKWHQHEFCVSRSTCEDVQNPVCYPETGHAEGYKWPIVLPNPPHPCDSMHVRPSDLGYQFQMKIAVTGFARIRSILLYGVEQPHGIYQGLTVQNTPPYPQAAL